MDWNYFFAACMADYFMFVMMPMAFLSIIFVIFTGGGSIPNKQHHDANPFVVRF